jgi:hypothetical protein
MVITEGRRVIRDEVELGEAVIVVATSPTLQGLEVADFLCDRDKRVTILTEWLYPGGHVDEPTMHAMYTRITGKDITIIPLVKVKEIDGNDVITANVLTGAERRIENSDALVFAPSEVADDGLYRAFKGKVGELYLIGHSLAPRTLYESILDGARVGRQI